MFSVVGPLLTTLGEQSTDDCRLFVALGNGRNVQTPLLRFAVDLL